MESSTDLPNVASTAESQGPPTHLVAIGASAGGLEALERLFRKMPQHTGMAFAVVQHLSRDFKSLMDELLARWTQMPIHEVEDQMSVRPNEIYLMPPKTEMVLQKPAPITMSMRSSPKPVLR